MVMAIFWEFMMGVLGTLRFFPGWNGQNVKEIGDSQNNFNEIFCSVDSFGNLIIRCMENKLVFSVKTFHTVMGASKCLRGGPIVNTNNKSHVDKV